MKKIVVIYAGCDDWEKEIPISNELTRKAFEQWHMRGLEIGVEMYRANIDWYDIEKGVFVKTWKFRDGAWQKDTSDVCPDLIYDKAASKYDYALCDRKQHIAKKVKIFNDPLFRAIVGNKLSQYMLFGEHMPLSLIASDVHNLEECVRKMPSQKVVVKPLYGSGGNGIVIAKKEEVLEQEYMFPVLVQEFIVSEKGIPGFSKKDEVSDLRLVFTNHELIYALSRIAKEGSLFTNLHQGASGTMVPREVIPQSIWDMTNAIIAKLQLFPHAQYSLDFIFSNDGKPYFIEMNTTPGIDLIFTLGGEDIVNKNFESLVAMVK